MGVITKLYLGKDGVVTKGGGLKNSQRDPTRPIQRLHSLEIICEDKDEDLPRFSEASLESPHFSKYTRWHKERRTVHNQSWMQY